MASNQAVVTQDFQHILHGEDLKSTDVLDTRNYIYAREPTFTIQSYLGYLDLIKPLAMATPVQDYMLRLGFVPLIMPPSFWGDGLHVMVLKHIPPELPYYPRPALSFLNFKYHSDFPDIWVSKLDAAELLGCHPKDVTVREVLKLCGI